MEVNEPFSLNGDLHTPLKNGSSNLNNYTPLSHLPSKYF